MPYRATVHAGPAFTDVVGLKGAKPSRTCAEDRVYRSTLGQGLTEITAGAPVCETRRQATGRHLKAASMIDVVATDSQRRQRQGNLH